MSGSITRLERAPLLRNSVQALVRDFIADQGLAPGDPLPPEGVLATQLGVSRSSVREAIRGLEAVGVIDVRHGVGVFVAHFSLQRMLEKAPYGLLQDVDELAQTLQVRRAVEVGVIGDVIEVIQADRLTELDAVVEEMRVHASRAETLRDQDREFHRLLHVDLNNRILLELLDAFWFVLQRASQRVPLTDDDPMKTFRDHLAVVEAVKARDVEEARAALDAHYDGIERRLKRAHQQVLGS